ncbi:hypothetical protein BIY21_08515 [Vibrio ponticus]|uniref:Porin family protein n=1 Tax=Vibrio ponticus TaxID=265668 RepID=A0A3N3DTY2_9VIBR|nr:AcfA family outer membrane beta-barrel protein [Vibrio ponticus]OLQ94630.1 hypothetical protein BIY21_08515 [Vibrio ponticus]ROV57964.1 porin family protein [Vibrio ponticus]
MKKICLFPLLALSLPAFASPYVGLEMGRAVPHHDIKVVDTTKNISISPDSDDIFLGLHAGYVLDKSWAVEFGYQKNQYTGTHNTHYQTTLESTQFALAPVYKMSLTNDREWDLKVKVGATYTQYDFTGKNTVVSGSKSSNELGLIGSIGVEYELMPELGVGVNYKYQSDSFSSASYWTVSTSYYF